MRLDDGLRLLLGLALFGACSDDGAFNQSSAQADGGTTTSGPALEEGGMTSGDTSPNPGTTSAEGATTAPPSDSSGGDSTGGGSDGGSTTIDVSTVTATATATDTGTDTGSEGSTTGGGNQACADGCAVEFMCGTEWMSEADCVMWCEANLIKAEAFSPFCADAWEAVSACLGTLTCEEFMQWQTPMMFPYPCSDADTALAVECEGQ